MKAKILGYGILMSFLSGCAFNPGEPSYDYVKATDDKATLVKVSGIHDPGVPLVVLPQTLFICGADDKNESGLGKKTANVVYLAPGEHVLCVRVHSGTTGILTEALYDKDIKFKVEYPNEYTIGFKNNFTSYSYWIKDKSGATVPFELVK